MSGHLMIMFHSYNLVIYAIKLQSLRAEFLFHENIAVVIYHIEPNSICPYRDDHWNKNLKKNTKNFI